MQAGLAGAAQPGAGYWFAVLDEAVLADWCDRYLGARPARAVSAPGISLARSRAASRAPILTAAAASDFVVLTNHMIVRRLPHEQPAATQISPDYPSSRTEWPLSY